MRLATRRLAGRCTSNYSDGPLPPLTLNPYSLFQDDWRKNVTTDLREQSNKINSDSCRSSILCNLLHDGGNAAGVITGKAEIHTLSQVLTFDSYTVVLPGNMKIDINVIQ